jgi:hypothetical protein
VPASGDLQFDAERMLTSLVLAKSAKAAGAEIDESPFVIDPAAVMAAAGSGAASGAEAVVEWLQLDPPLDAVKTAPSLLAAHASHGVIDAFGEWAGRSVHQNGRSSLSNS